MDAKRELERIMSRMEPYKITKPVYVKKDKAIVYREMTGKERRILVGGIIQAIFAELPEIGYVRLKDVEIDKDKLTSILWSELPGGLQNAVKLTKVIVGAKGIMRVMAKK